jgi:hypothetical protein
MPSNDLTLAFSLQALEKLARPKRAFEDAATGPRSIGEALSSLRNHFETERYVFVGTDETDGIVETVPEWTFQSLIDAATAADWRLESASTVDDDWP